MANYTTDPNTGIKIPTVNQDPGPDYATNISEALTTLSGLGHSGAPTDGKQIVLASLNINGDVTFNQVNNLTNARSIRFTNQSSTLSGVGDIGSIYEMNGNFY